MKRTVGTAAFLIALGMLLMLIVSSTLVGVIIIGLLVIIGCNCYGKY